MTSPFRFRTEDNTTVWIFNIAQSAYFGRSRFFYNLAIGVEVLFTILCLLTIVFFGMKAILHPPVHINLVIITLVKLLLFSISFTARLVMILFESGAIVLLGFGCHPIPLLNRIRLIWIIGILNYNGPMYLERCAATFFVRDYERNRRIYIALLLVLSDFLLIFLVTHIIAYALFNEYAIFFIFWIPNFYFYFANRSLLKRNQQRLDRLNNPFLIRAGNKCKTRDAYTLSLRLQLDENIWCLKQISAGCLIFIVGVIGTGALVCIPPLFSYDDDTMWILQSFVVFANAAMPTVSLLVIVSIGLSLDRFRVLVLPQCILDRIERNKKAAMIEETPRRRTTRVEHEGNLYFSRLTDVWESDVRVHM